MGFGDLYLIEIWYLFFGASFHSLIFEKNLL